MTGTSPRAERLQALCNGGRNGADTRSRHTATMVAARKEFVAIGAAVVAEPGFAGDWVLDRVHGLIDATAMVVQRLRIDEQALHVEIRRRGAEQAVLLTGELNGGVAEARSENASCSVQALLEGHALIWELDYEADGECARVRRVMQLSKQGSQLLAERVDMNTDGVLLAVRTEYWTRAGVGRPAAH